MRTPRETSLLQELKTCRCAETPHCPAAAAFQSSFHREALHAVCTKCQIIKAHLSGISCAPACPPSPKNFTSRAAGAAMAVTMPMSVCSCSHTSKSVESGVCPHPGKWQSWGQYTYMLQLMTTARGEPHPRQLEGAGHAALTPHKVKQGCRLR